MSTGIGGSGLIWELALKSCVQYLRFTKRVNCHKGLCVLLTLVGELRSQVAGTLEKLLGCC